MNRPPKVRITGSSTPDGAEGQRAVVVDSPESGEEALVLVAHGEDLRVDLRLVGDVREQFLDDLGRVAELEIENGGRAAGLSVEHLALLRALGEGSVLSKACRDLGLSRRTATRRLAEARSLLQVATTTEAVLAVGHADGRS